VKGAALATILGQIVTCVMGLIYLGRFKSISPGKEDYKIKWKYCKATLALGVSSFITQMAIVVVMAVINNLLTQYGAASVYGEDIPLAVMGIVMKVNQLVIAATVGIASGAQPIIGYNYGAGNPQRVKKTFGWVVLLAEVLAVAAFIAYQCFPVQLISIFGKEGDLYNEFATKCFRIFLLVVILNGFQTVAGLFAQAIGHPVKAAAMSLSRQIIFLVPAEFLLAAKMGVMGVLWAGPVADTLAFLLALVLVVYDLAHLKQPHPSPAHCAS
jgi:Na+-driven multidrug efflux pump